MKHHHRIKTIADIESHGSEARRTVRAAALWSPLEFSFERFVVWLGRSLNSEDCRLRNAHNLPLPARFFDQPTWSSFWYFQIFPFVVFCTHNRQLTAWRISRGSRLSALNTHTAPNEKAKFKKLSVHSNPFFLFQVAGTLSNGRMQTERPRKKCQSWSQLGSPPLSERIGKVSHTVQSSALEQNEQKNSKAKTLN